MVYLDELKKFVHLHVNTQGLSDVLSKNILSEIDEAEGYRSGSWARVWGLYAEEALCEGDLLLASTFYNMARFPMLNEEARADAHAQCVSTFLQFITKKDQTVSREIFSVGGHDIPFYLKNVNKPNRPLLIVLGGIVSIKEQWHAFLQLGDRLNCNIALCEMPGVGENKLVYQPDMSLMMNCLTKKISLLCPYASIHFVAFSFSCVLAMQFAAVNDAVKTIITIDPPIKHFFIEKKSFLKMPLITRKVLSFISGCDEHDLKNNLPQYAINDDILKKIRAHVFVIASKHDEVVPVEDKKLLKQQLNKVFFVEFDDVHGAPHHMKQIQYLIGLTLFRSINRFSLGYIFLQSINLIKKMCFWQSGYAFKKSKKVKHD